MVKLNNGDIYQKDWDALRAYVYEHAFELGDFTLTSGKKSKYYFDGKQVTLSPEGAYLLGRILYHKIKDLGIDAVGGITIGADPIAGALAAVSFIEGMHRLKLFIVRKTPKKHGKFKLIEGPALEAGDRVVVVDDVITTGGSIIEAIKAVRDAGCEVVKAIALVDRCEGGTENIKSLGIDVDPVFTINDFL
ncbi:MAG: Orotate phosphoribosyltransferase, partial [Pelotomaculum thermopropionicum]